MSVVAIAHGAGGCGWEWHLVAERLRAAGHDVVAPDLPCEDEAATFDDYAAVLLDAVGDRDDVVVVGHSLGAYTATLAAARLPGASLVLASAMVPRPGEPAGGWWAATGCPSTDLGEEAFWHDLPPALRAEAAARSRGQAETPARHPLPLDALPDVPTRAVLFADDRVFPLPFMRALVRDRLGIEDPAVVPGGHCAYLVHPDAVAAALVP